MYFSKQEVLDKNSLSMFKGLVEKGIRKRRIQDHNQIKINRSKLPPDFFKRSAQRSLPRNSALDTSSNRLSLPRTTVLRKYPQTQRKINSFNNLPQSTQIDHMYEFALGKTHNLRLDEGQKFNINRKIILQEIDTSLEQFQQINQQKCMNYVKQKCLKRKQVIQQVETKSELRNILKQRFPNKFNQEKCHEQKTYVSEEIQMGCTFGKGFRKHQNSLFENSPKIKDQPSYSVELSDENIHGYRYQKSNHLLNRLNEQKSTQESEVYENVKINEKSPIKVPYSSRILFGVQRTPYFEDPNTNNIKWNIYHHDMGLFGDLSVQKSKEVFTAEERERKSKYRMNNSSNDYREKAVRKDQKLGEVCLPKITKG